MKTLYIIRHAKSSWKDDSIKDHDRPLNNRGQRSAPFMGQKLKEKGIKPDLIISSTATRALSTARLFASELDYPLECIMDERRVYESSVSELQHMISQVSNKVDSLMLFGHNPSLSMLVDYFTESAEDLVTCAVAKIDFEINDWLEAGRGTGTLDWVDYPKKYPEMVND